jgi:hypothetical protein
VLPQNSKAAKTRMDTAASLNFVSMDSISMVSLLVGHFNNELMREIKGIIYLLGNRVDMRHCKDVGQCGKCTYIAQAN